MKKRNSVYIGVSLDGYISDKNGGLDWLDSIPNTENNNMGFEKFMNQIDALVMGRTTFETVCNFDCDWPYTKPVFVLSSTLNSLPKEYQDKAELIKGSLSSVLDQIHKKGYNRLYIDGGTTIQNFLKEDLIDDLIITTIPVLIGGGTPLFSELPREMKFELVKSEVFLNQIVQNHYRRKP